MIARTILASLPDNLPESDAQAAARRRRNIVIVILGIVALVAAAAITTPSFLTVENLITVVRAASITGIVAVGMSYITISGNLFALSAEELAILSACVFAWLMRADYGLRRRPGSHHRLLRRGWRDPGWHHRAGRRPDHHHACLRRLLSWPRIAGQPEPEHHVRGRCRALDRHRPPARHPDPELGIRHPDAVLAWFVLQKTRFGRQLLLIGANRETARATGLRVGQASLVALTIFGVCCGLAGISAASQFGLAVANLFTGLNIDVIAAVLVGGISLRGGQGSPIQAALGAVFIALLQNYMLLHSFSTGQRMLVVGCLVALATLGFHMIQRSRG